MNEKLKPVILVCGVGGAGSNAVNNMINNDLKGATFITSNTDAQALDHSAASIKIQLGPNITKGLGAGSTPKIGATSADESREDIKKAFEGANMVFITAGMGGGTGTGSAPVIAKIAKDMGILTIGVVTKPFDFEGAYRMQTAMQGIEELKKYIDTLIIIPNQNLFRLASETTTFLEAFKMSDDILYSGVKSITDLVNMPGLINLDFADIRTIMSGMGTAVMGTGESSDEERAVNAARIAVTNPLLDHSAIQGAKSVLVNVTGGLDITLHEVDAAANHIRESVSNASANIIFGSSFDSQLEGAIRVSVIATGIETVSQENDNTDEQQDEQDKDNVKPTLKNQDEVTTNQPKEDLEHSHSKNINKNSNLKPHTPLKSHAKLNLFGINKTTSKSSKDTDYGIPTFLRNNKKTDSIKNKFFGK